MKLFVLPRLLLTGLVGRSAKRRQVQNAGGGKAPAHRGESL